MLIYDVATSSSRIVVSAGFTVLLIYKHAHSPLQDKQKT